LKGIWKILKRGLTKSDFEGFERCVIVRGATDAFGTAERVIFGSGRELCRVVFSLSREGESQDLSEGGFSERPLVKAGNG
jgi:hypothetical protein